MSVDQILDAINRLEQTTGFRYYPNTGSVDYLVPPLPETGCLGVHTDGTIDREFRCLKNYDEEGARVYTCAGWRYFRVSCPSRAANMQCSSLSGAWVSAVTVCNQRLY